MQVKEHKFLLEITIDEEGLARTQTTNNGLPYDVIVAALNHQIYLYNKMWAEQSSITVK
ncbi:MAG: hypothetical protein ABIH11_08995 [Candidatus Altiarchaeota archaeon]